MIDEKDLQTVAIDRGLTALQEQLDNPVARSALDLNKNAAAAHEYDVLQRTRKSLRQYIERNGQLFYVGLLGHFSAGKSSTINSLLDLWNSQHERKTGQNPTDTTITLITQQKNAESLVGVIREGHVPIRLVTVESPVLDQLVIADTPGTGDPQFIEEVARDFLPICDVILFLLSAASPLDKSDVPLLTELHKRLPFIPLHFVITRADEFRKNSDKPLTEENFDQTQKEEFLQGVIARLNILLAPEIYMPASFIFLDNKSKFRLEELLSFLASKCNSSSTQAHVSMHMNKLMFYLSGAKRLRSFFRGLLDGKLGELGKIVQAAAKNIEKYQQNVQISNINLTKTWTEYVAAIMRATSDSLEIAKPPLAIPADIANFPTVAAKRQEILNDLIRDARYNAGSVASALKAQAVAAIQDHFYKMQKSIAETQLEKLSATDHVVPSVTVATEIRNTEMLSPGLLSRRCGDLREAEAMTLRGVAGELRRYLKELDELLLQRLPLKDCERVIETASDGLRADLQKFFQNVELYRSGVFSLTTKESIATLGIGGRLDELEKEFTEDDRAAFATEATNDFFPDVQQLFSSVGLGLSDLSPKVRVLVEESRTFRVDLPSDDFVGARTAWETARDRLHGELRQELQGDVDRFCGTVSLNVSNLLVDAKTRFDAQVRVLNQSRLRQYLVAFCVTTFILGAGYLSYSRLEKPGPTTTFGQGALNLVCSVIIELIVLGIVRWRANLPKRVSETKELIHTKLNEEVRQATEVALREHTFPSLNESSLNARLSKIYQQALSVPSDDWKHSTTETLATIRKWNSEYGRCRTEFAALVEKLRIDGAAYFTDEGRNIAVLSKTAAGIRERAIEPSFALLDKTQRELLSVKAKVESVQFD